MQSTRFLEMKDGGHYFVITANNGEAILTSQRYRNARGMYNAWGRVLKYAHYLSHYQLQSDSGCVFYFVLKGCNGRILGTSEMYHSAESAQKGINAFREPARVSPTNRRRI